MFRFVVISALAGIVVPGALLVARQVITGAGDLSVGLMWLTIALWPSSIMLMGTADEEALSSTAAWIYVASITVNALIYAGLGAALCYGLNRNKAVLIGAGVVVALIWAVLSSL
jgi:hypothetical protein